MNRPGALSLRLYRMLARAFPYEFKNAYGEELVGVAEDAINPIWRNHGTLGLARLVADIAVRVAAEHLTEIQRDVRYGLRVLASSTGFTAVALISLSLGICIATCAYSEMQGLILRDLPGVPSPNELVALQTPTSYPTYKQYRELHDLFSSTFAYIAPVPFGVSIGGSAERVWGHLITPSYFSTLGVHPALGGLFDDGQEQSEARAVVVSYRFWQNRLGFDHSAIGKTLRINGQPVTIAGVGPKDFLGASPLIYAADLWMPVWVGGYVAPELAGNALERRDLTMFQVAGRLKPGVSEASAETELDSVSLQLERSYGEVNRDEKRRRVLLVAGGKVLPFRKQDLPLFTEFFMVLGGLVLLIACSNVANMMLARATGRRKEIAVRLSLGASRARLIRQLLTESMLIAFGAGVLGFLLSMWLMHLLSRMRMPYPMPMAYDLNVDTGALWFTLGLTVLAGLGFSLLPAFQTTRTDLTGALKEGGNVRLSNYRRLSLRNVLLVAQVAGSLMLLLIVGILSLGIQTSMGVEQGINPKNLYLISLDPIRDGYSGAQAAEFFAKLLDRVQSLPSVRAVCLTDTVPVAFSGNGGVTFTAGGASQAVYQAQKYVVGRNYFDTAGIAVLRGRGFQKEDETNDASTVVVSEKLARDVWKEEDPLGRRIDIGNGPVSPGVGAVPGTFDYRSIVSERRHSFEVVGVAKDVSEDFIANKIHPAVYFPLRAADYANPSLRGITLLVRAVPGADVIGGVRREVMTIDTNLTPFNARSMVEQIAQFLTPLRGAAWTYGCVGFFGLILASVGLAGMTAYSVTQRRREIGIRVALGATRGDVLGLVMKQGAALVIIGSLIGWMGAWAALRALSGLFSTVASTSETNPVLLAGAPLLLATVALIACYVPARQSTRIDPAVTLRQE